MCSLISNKKAVGLRNVLVIPITLVVFGILTIFGFVFTTYVISAVETSPVYDAATMATPIAGFNSAMLIWDKIVIVLALSLVVGVVITSYKLFAAPVYFIISILLAIFMTFISLFFNYFFAQFVSQSVFTTTILYFPATLLICQNLHWISLIVIVAGSIALYSKPERDAPETLR